MTTKFLRKDVDGEGTLPQLGQSLFPESAGCLPTCECQLKEECCWWDQNGAALRETGWQLLPTLSTELTYNPGPAGV